MMVRVEWIDAYVEHGRLTEEELQESKPIRRTTIGYLVAENDDVVVVSPESMVIDGIAYYEDTMTIPKSFVQGQIRKLRVTK